MPVHIIENAGPPSAAPSAIGIHFIDTVSGIHYFSTGTSTVADWARTDKVIEDTADPSSAPPAIGLHWVNTASGVEFFSTGTSVTEDWKERGAGGGGGGGGGGFASTYKHIQIAAAFVDGMLPVGQNRFRVSEDGCKTFGGRYSMNKWGGKWWDLSDGGMVQGVTDHVPGKGVMLAYNKTSDGTPLTGYSIEWFRDTSAGTPFGYERQNITTASGSAPRNYAGEDFFAYVAQHSSQENRLMCMHTASTGEAVGEFIDYTTNAQTWFSSTILGPADPLRVQLETGAIPAMYGLWSFGGNWFCAVETTQGDFEDVTVYRSVDLDGQNWTSYGTFEDWGGIHAGHATAVNKSAPNFVHGALPGQMVVPGIGVFVFASDNGTNHCPVIYKDGDGASGFGIPVYTYSDEFGEGACPNPPVHWELNMRGWVFDEVEGETIIWAGLYNNTTGTRTFVVSNDGGNSWFPGIYDGDSGYAFPFFPTGISSPFPSGWNRCWMPFWNDGYGCRGFFNNGTDYGAIVTVDGIQFFLDPYLNTQMGPSLDPWMEQLKRANGTPNWFPIVRYF